jgi:glycosyltransferase involved in cell wall biosynthesis
VEVHVITPTSQPGIIHLQHGEMIQPDSDFSSSGATITIEKGVQVHRVLAPYSNLAGDIYSRVIEVNKILEAYIRRVEQEQGRWDIVHTHDWLTGFTALALKRDDNHPLAVTIHATERGRGRGYLSGHLQWSIDKAERELIETADQVIVCSRHMLHELDSFFQTPAEKMVVVPNGVDITGLQNSVDKHDLAEFRARYAKFNDQIVFTVSRLVHEKGVHRLVEATPRILAECPLARIIIAGKGPEADNLKQQTESLGVADRVDFIGFIPDEDRNRLFRVANCAVFPSLYEPFGIVALEAMALGCPVVVSDIGGLAEVVTHTVTGLTTYADNPESVAWGVLRALTHPELAQKYAATAKEWVAQFFNWPRIALLTREVYEGVVEKQQVI